MKHVFIHRFHRAVGADNLDTLVAFIAVRELDEGAVAGELEMEVDVRLVPDELVIVSRESIANEIVRKYIGRGPFRRLRERLLPDTPSTLVTFDGSGAEATRRALTDSAKLSTISLDDVLRRGGTDIFRRNGGFIEATSAYHFRNPSGRHTSRFMRLSNILVRQAEINFLAVCALCYIPKTTRTIYVDTPSLFAIVAALNDIRQSEDALPPIPADSYHSYHKVRTYKHFRTENAIALISASSSGGLAKLLVERGFNNKAVVHLLFLGKKLSDFSAVLDLHVDDGNPFGFTPTREGNGDGDCSLCNTGSIPITLEGDQFDIAGPQPEPLVITRTTSHNALRDLMERHAGTHAFRVNGSRPVRQFAIASESVARKGKALERLRYHALARIPASLGHCIAANQHSNEFAKRVLAAAGSTAPILTPDQFDAKVAAAANGFEEPILIVSAVIGSGRQLMDISRRMRSCPKAPLVYFVGIAATPSAKRMQTLRSSLELTSNPTPHPLIVIDEIDLPGTDAPNAWETELAFLDEVANGGYVLTPELMTRRRRLQRTSVPLECEVFLANSSTSALKLQPGFAFWTEVITLAPHSQADVYYTISSVLQGLRTAEGSIDRKTLRTEWFYRTLLSPENFGRFNDAVVQASLLRAARPSELDYTDNTAASAEAARLIRRILESATTARGEAAAEFLLALAMKRLKLARGDVAKVLESLPPQTTIVDQLAEICRERLLEPQQEAVLQAPI